MKKIRTFNDGVVDIKKQIPKEIDYNSKIKQEDEFILLHTLRFEYKACRQEDTEFIKSLGHTLSKKIKTPLLKISTANYGFINKEKFSIIHIDDDHVTKEMYIYLEKVGINND